MYQYTPYVLPLIVSTAFLGYVFVYSYRLRKQVEVAALRIDSEGTIIPITTSIGIAFAENNSDIKLEKLIDMADKALYQSKQNGRNRVTVWRS